MQLKSTSDTPTLMVDAVTPRPSVVDCAPPLVVVLDLGLLEHDARKVAATNKAATVMERARRAGRDLTCGSDRRTVTPCPPVGQEPTPAGPSDPVLHRLPRSCTPL